jgi:hypothetical protein
MVYAVSASVHDNASVSGARSDEKSALKLALEYRQQGFTNIRVVTEDGASYSLEEFRQLVE